MENILLSIRILTGIVVLFPVIYLIVSWNKLIFRDWKEVIISPLDSVIKSLIDFAEIIISVVVVSVVMQIIIAHPTDSTSDWNLLVHAFVKYLSLIFGIFWSKYSIQLIEKITKRKVTNQGEVNSKYRIYFVLSMWLFFFCAIGLLCLLQMA